jgi:hypothetical protein
MFTILIIAALAVAALGSAGYGAIAYRNERKRRRGWARAPARRCRRRRQDTC